MKKYEILWREILNQTIEAKNTIFRQKQLAAKFGFSTSTVFHALKKPRAIGAIRVWNRGFELINFEKLLFLWASERKFRSDIIYQTKVNSPVFEIEGNLPPNIIPATYTAFRLKFNNVPADYDKVYVYTGSKKEVKRRFPPTNGEPNLIVLKMDPWLKQFAPFPPLSQIFVDLWNLPEWYAKEFQNALLDKIKAKLGQ